MKKPHRFNIEDYNVAPTLEVLRTHPIYASMQHIIVPVFEEMAPIITEEYKKLAIKANARLDALEGSEEVEEQTFREYQVKIMNVVQTRSIALMLPKVLQSLLMNSDKEVPVNKKQMEMVQEFRKGQFSDSFVSAIGSIATSVVASTPPNPVNAQRIRFMNAQIKDSSSNFSQLLRDQLKRFAPNWQDGLNNFIDLEKMRDILTTMFSDELNKQCELLETKDNSSDDNSEDVEDSKEILSDIILCLTDEESSAYKVLTEAAKLFLARAHYFSQESMQIFMKRTHLDVHQALEKEAPKFFEAKSPRSARNRYFCQWTKEEDVTAESFNNGPDV